MDKILLVFGLIIAFVIIVTGGFGILSKTGINLGFNLTPASEGPRATGPGTTIGSGEGITESDNASHISTNPGNSGNNNPNSQPSSDSKYKGHIKIVSVSASSRTVGEEYILIHNNDQKGASPITITAWQVNNTEGKKYIIGGAMKIALLDTAGTVRLNPGDEAYIHTGRSPIGTGFEENACTGYLNQNYLFKPSLGESCPKPSASVLQFKDACLRVIERISSCRVPTISNDDAFAIGDECNSYITQNFNYNGCVNNYRKQSDFLKSTWHLYLDRTEKLWRDFHDIITLYDGQGLLVDTYQY